MPTVNDADGQPAVVDSDGRLAVRAVRETEAKHINLAEQEAYSVLVDVTTAGANEDFFYLKNNDDKAVVIYRIEGWCDDISQEISVLIGGTSAGQDAGDALIPVNMNAGSGQVANVDCTQDATDLVIPGGSAVTLLKFPVTPYEREVFYFEAGIILTKNKRLHMQALLAGLINLNIYMYFH